MSERRVLVRPDATGILSGPRADRPCADSSPRDGILRERPQADRRYAGASLASWPIRMWLPNGSRSAQSVP